MNLWILELYDQWFECPVTIGVYTTMEKARDDILAAETWAIMKTERRCFVK